MTRLIHGSSLALLIVGSLFVASVYAKGQDDWKHVTKAARAAAITRAQVWRATDVAAIDVKAGPSGKDAFAFNETVECTYVSRKLAGRTPKFACTLSDGDEIKVKYGDDNGEVYAEVLASRLLWTLGFGADGMYPARVVCRGCPSTLRGAPAASGGVVTFETAAIERKMPGHEMSTRDDEGWSWAELPKVNPSVGGAPLAHRDALTLLATFMQHTDNKPQQQRLVCLSDGAPAAGCPEPFMMISDLGVTFGRRSGLNVGSVSSVNLEKWVSAPVWADEARCVAFLPKSLTGELDNPRISEAGRAFLAELLSKLSDQQISDLFDVSRVTTRAREASQGTSVDEWVNVFKAKRDRIVSHRCPA